MGVYLDIGKTIGGQEFVSVKTPDGPISFCVGELLDLRSARNTKDARSAELEQRDLIIGSRLDDALAKIKELEALLGECKPSVTFELEFYEDADFAKANSERLQEMEGLLARIESALGEVEGE